ncbi:hypothetical protein AJ80_03926 [Polytolypa hystricis UAMH7299]|uniref:Uncharacterized protein n=1 Tax=Polytolypa hystricis (strain UAMH7299) TaxID=1447883 RepID=A0A2B7YD24_POLH7|nr:hypothetical protein AJ80_03926 [Polytolypa hystricis UAMH7299]
MAEESSTRDRARTAAEHNRMRGAEGAVMSGGGIAESSSAGQTSEQQQNGRRQSGNDIFGTNNQNIINNRKSNDNENGRPALGLSLPTLATGAGGGGTVPTPSSPLGSPVHNSPTLSNPHEPHALSQTQAQSPIDPVSQHILKRTTTDKSAASRLRAQAALEADSGPSDSPESGSILRRDTSLSHKTTAKDKKKGVSFLSRFIGSIKKENTSDADDNASELGEHRCAGMDAEVFAQPIGFIPRYPPPPKYIKVRAHHKKEKDFDRLFVAQELCGTRSSPAKQSGDKSSTVNVFESDVIAKSAADKAIWALEFSKDGKFVAAAGKDAVVRVWAVIATREDRQAHEIEEDARDDQPYIRLSAPVFKSQPVREYEGHTASVVDLSWSKNNFLLSTSMDKTVRLWHLTRNECLCCFQHSDFVTSIEFHPRDDRFFLAGSLDLKLRLWSIPDKNVAFLAVVPDMITAVSFTPDGKYAIAGCLNGLCVIYETEGLKIHSQVHVRSARGRNAKGSKITGIDTIIDPNGIVKLLITSNDSRIRMYNFRDRTLHAKFRGNENATSQIRASFSSDGRYVICGSEDRRVYVWNADTSERDSDKRPVEIFEAHSSTVTAAVMAPIQTKQILGSTGDLLYDLCNPPPVTLVSQTASVTSKAGIEDGKARAADDSVPPTPHSPTYTNNHKPEESPAYLARSSHPNGNIIVTADCNGKIKVFRQDCGYHKRRPETWDTNSTFSRKLFGRTNSVSTRRSIASSFSGFPKTPSDRILSWRNAVLRQDNSSTDNFRQGTTSSTRSISPRQSVDQGLRGSAPQVSITPAEPSASAGPTSSTDLRRSITNGIHPKTSPPSPIREDPTTITSNNGTYPLKVPPWTGTDPTGTIYWDRLTADTAERAQRPSHDTNRSNNTYLDPHDAASTNGALLSLTRKHSAVSALSSDVSSGNEGIEIEEGEELRCPSCRGSNFRATRTKTGEQKLTCVQCGFIAS